MGEIGSEIGVEVEKTPADYEAEALAILKELLEKSAVETGKKDEKSWIDEGVKALAILKEIAELTGIEDEESSFDAQLFADKLKKGVKS